MRALVIGLRGGHRLREEGTVERRLPGRGLQLSAGDARRPGHRGRRRVQRPRGDRRGPIPFSLSETSIQAASTRCHWRARCLVSTVSPVATSVSSAGFTASPARLRTRSGSPSSSTGAFRSSSRRARGPVRSNAPIPERIPPVWRLPPRRLNSACGDVCVPASHEQLQGNRLTHRLISSITGMQVVA